MASTSKATHCRECASATKQIVDRLCPECTTIKKQKEKISRLKAKVVELSAGNGKSTQVSDTIMCKGKRFVSDKKRDLYLCKSKDDGVEEGYALILVHYIDEENWRPHTKCQELKRFASIKCLDDEHWEFFKVFLAFYDEGIQTLAFEDSPDEVGTTFVEFKLRTYLEKNEPKMLTELDEMIPRGNDAVWK